MQINEDILIKYFNKGLTFEENSKVEEWIDASEENFKEAKNIFFILKFSKQLNIADSVDTDNAYAHFQNILNKRNRQTIYRKFVLWSQKAAAILVIPLILTTIFMYSHKNSNLNCETSFITVKSKVGMVSSVILPDSTKVWLNSNSSIRYPSTFSNNKRNVEMTGQAYFEVTKNPHKPFIVKVSPNYAVRVLGTKFNVTHYGNKIETTLVEGAVCLNINGKKDAFHLMPNDKSVYNIKKNTIYTKKVNTDLEISWVDGIILFKNTCMYEVMNRLARNFNVTFEVHDQSIYKSRITGKFKDETIEQILYYLHIASGINYKIRPSYVTDDNTLTREVVEISK